ncbi:MAG: tRNA (adenosine(37)-N6)-threonylcarbamoyltransferase complex dimerization subunit type 1 TsaB [Clostridiales bacterium]|nr:tRNA (adenosine(37)-N6)-threonylcarbamoyltransferase complex dimerization subunit type 1 TsaB [Clostridiales bacterium]
MKILGIESASMVASVAVVTDDVLTAEYTVNFKKTHSQTLLPMIDEVARMLELDLHTLDAVAVSGGPGSFTGLRIGSATAKGIGLALELPLIHVPTLDAMAYQIFGTQALICPIMDARRGQVYTGLYEFEEQFKVIVPSRAMAVTELAEELNERGQRVIFLGDGIPVYREILEAGLTVPYSFAPAQMNRERAASVAALGAVYFKNGQTETAQDHRPDYLRKAQAERELEEARRQGKTAELAAGHSVGTGNSQ